MECERRMEHVSGGKLARWPGALFLQKLPRRGEMPSREEDLTRAQDGRHRVTDTEGRSPTEQQDDGRGQDSLQKICANLTMYFNILRGYISADFGGSFKVFSYQLRHVAKLKQ